MVSIGNVWDRTVAVLSGRTGILLAIAALLLVLPTAIDAAFDIPAVPGPGLRIAGGLASIAAGVLSIWASLAMIAVASDPDVDRPHALAIARARILPAFGIALLLGLAMIVLVLPGVALIATSGFDVERAQQGLEQIDVDYARIGLALLYLAAASVAALWAAARLTPLFPIVLNERVGVGAFRRSFRLTRGSTWKLIGVILLFGIVLFVALIAAIAIVALIARLIVGAGNPGIVGFAGAVASAIVTAGFTIVQSVFSTQFYRAACERIDPATLSA